MKNEFTYENYHLRSVKYRQTCVQIVVPAKPMQWIRIILII